MTAFSHDLVLVTGPSGAGLSTASRALEDIGFEAIDNLPLRLVQPLLAHPGRTRPMALGLDLRNRDFSTGAVLELLADLADLDGVKTELLYLECRADEIQRRYSSTRRRHPLTEPPTLADSIAHEIELLRPIKARADVLIDTSQLNPHELRAEIETWFATGPVANPAVQIQSFSYKRGLPRSADLVFDCRFLRNPHWQEDLRAEDGRHPAVQAYVEEDPRFDAFLAQITDLASFMLPAAAEEGKRYLTIALGCTGGRHRSVTLAERLSHALAAAGWPVSIRHRELDRLSQPRTSK